MKLLIVNAHPDDAEFACASTCQQAVDLNWEVHELLMTTDEYGHTRDDFKGKRIKRIRKFEMEEAAKVYGINPDGSPKIKLIWLGEIDGYLPFNRDVFQKLKQKILEIKPDIVIGPDSFFSMDLHVDHNHTGWLIYLVIKSLDPKRKPILLLYQSYNTNFYIPIKDITIQVKAWSKHKSQNSPLSNKLNLPIRKFYYFLSKRKTGPIIAEGFRKVDFFKNENQIIKLRHRILYTIVASKFSGPPRKRYFPTPKELGLVS